MACRNHPLVDTGIEHCEICAETYCADCLVEFQEKRVCGECKTQVVADLEFGGRVSGDGVLPPWERREELGLVGAFWQTSKAVILTPNDFFDKMEKNSQSFTCLLYAVIVQVLAAIANWIYSVVMFGIIAAVAGGGGEFEQAMAGPFGVGVQGFIGVIFAPIGAIIGVFVGAGLMHLYLYVTKLARVPYQQTMRGLCYAHAPQLLLLIPIPFLNQIVGGIWTIVAEVIMINRLHKCGWLHAIASLLWIAVLCGCIFGGIFLVIAIVGAAAN